MLQYCQFKLDYKNDSKSAIRKKLAKNLHIGEDKIKKLRIVKKSVDARKKPAIFFNYTVVFECEHEDDILKKNINNANLTKYINKPDFNSLINSTKSTKEKIIVVGSGPAGLLCSYFLAKSGCQPVIVERGGSMWERVEKVAEFWKDGKLDPDTNVSFGEGGAGTFSDGKLNTGVKDKTGKKDFILNAFIEHGAPEEIRYLTKPHIGTDELREVIISMRQTIESLGGTYLFHTKCTGFIYEDDSIGHKQRKIKGIIVSDENGEEKLMACDKCVLAIGHSARDTFEMIESENIEMEAKPFAVGVRVEHLQKKINESQYGTDDNRLPAADYKLTARTSDDRGVYSFCMCPGGYVVNASTEQGQTVVNGMSNHARDSKNANSAIVVTVDEKDYGNRSVLAGMEFQRELEQRAYEVGRGKIPVQTFSDFKKGECSKKFGEVEPCTKGEIMYANVKNLLPTYISNGIIEGMKIFGSRIKGFDDDDTLILGTETRTSSPVRIVRNEDFVSNSVLGLYPCGEGAGYAGGIMSAAMDGLRVAFNIAKERTNLKDENSF